MTTILIANIGNRDVWIDKAAPIPGEIHPAWNDKASRRALGKALLDDWSNCHPHLGLPIISKAVDYVRRQSDRLDQVILVSSDQAGQENVSERHLAQDTCELALVVQQLLVEKYGLGANAIAHWTVRDNPADYGVMQAFFRAQLTALRADEAEAAYYLEVSGGTPAMTSMLLTVGAEVLGLAAYPLYVSEHEQQPFPLDLGRRMVADALLHALRANLNIYAYHAAAQMVCHNRNLLREFVAVEALLAALEYARQRLNFNFEHAQQAINKAPPGPWSNRLAQLSAELQPDRAEWLLHEIVYNAESRLETGAYGDFLVRIFRFDEGALRYTARRLGVHLVDKKGQDDPDGEYLETAWLDSKSGLKAYLRKKNVQVEKKVPANRYVLALVITFLARQCDETAPRALLKQLGKFDELSKVRNKSFAVHTFDGVSRRRIVQAFTGNVDATGSDDEIKQILAALRKVCAATTGQTFDSINPYTAVNDLILELLIV